MHFSARAFQLAKDPEHPEEFQDAYGLDPARGVAAIADGVASGIFSGLWARLLIEAIVREPLDPRDQPAFAQWLHDRRQAWSAQIDVSKLAWFQKAKLPRGAFSTLLWLCVRKPPADQPEAYRLRGFAIGDSCLFHVRDGELLRSFPVQKAAELLADPLVLGSVDLHRDHLLQFAAIDEPCYEGDLLILCTDAVAHWFLRLVESQQSPCWEQYWSMSEDAWRQEVLRLREQGVMRYDDATLVLLRPEAVK